MDNENVYLPKLARLISIKKEVSGARPIKTFRAQLLNETNLSHRCGQCAMVSVFGKGESMFAISSSPLVKDYLQFSIMKMGRVTSELHAMKEGDIWIKTWYDDENVYIKVKDNGYGIPQEKVGRIFDPFFTTKEKGTGLGLSLSYRIIQDHQGDFRVESEIQKGTTMTIRLPKKV